MGTSIESRVPTMEESYNSMKGELLLMREEQMNATKAIMEKLNIKPPGDTDPGVSK